MIIRFTRALKGCLNARNSLRWCASPFVAALSSSTRSGPSTEAQVRIATYNILSSHLAEPDYFTNCDPDVLEADYRLEKIISKLESEIAQNAIICMQEVSISWVGPLQTFFSERGYQLITANYGNHFNNFMGVGVAIPTKSYFLVEADVCRLADTITQTVPREQRGSDNGNGGGSSDSYSRGLLSRLKRAFGILVGKEGRGAQGLRNQRQRNRNSEREETAEEKILKYWRDAEARKNQMICVRLRDATTLRSFCVGTYHMPCAFRTPPMMMMHCALSAHKIADFADADPYVYAGDFNITPESPMYTLLTKGEVPPGEPTQPRALPNATDRPGVDDWYTSVTPLRSAYKLHDGREPDFTNFAQVRNDTAFIDTLDYIFVSKEWGVSKVLPLEPREATRGPLPTAEEPSDHVMIASTLSLRV